MTLKKLEDQIAKLRSDRTARQARLEAIEPDHAILRAQLKRARGEAELGSASAKKTALEIEQRLGALADERDAVEGAIEILGERITTAETALSQAKANERETVAAACRRAEEEAFEAFCVAFRGVVEPLQRMAAAHHIAAGHGIVITDRGRTIRERLRAAGHESERTEGRRQQRVFIPAAQGIPTEIMSGTEAFLPGYISAVEDLVHDLQRDGVPLREVAQPEPEIVERAGSRPAFPMPALEVEEPPPATEVIVMGRTRPDAIIADVAVAQSARPPAGFRGSSPKPAATSEPNEQIAAFPGRRA